MKIERLASISPEEMDEIKKSHLPDEVLAKRFKIPLNTVRAFRPKGFQPSYFPKPATYTK